MEWLSVDGGVCWEIEVRFNLTKSPQDVFVCCKNISLTVLADIETQIESGSLADVGRTIAGVSVETVDRRGEDASSYWSNEENLCCLGQAFAREWEKLSPDGLDASASIIAEQRGLQLSGVMEGATLHDLHALAFE